VAAIEPAASDGFVGLEDAERRLPERWAMRRDRMVNAAVIGFIAVIQVAWFALFGYAAYRFIF
jgi:hypothetical protein